MPIVCNDSGVDTGAEPQTPTYKEMVHVWEEVETVTQHTQQLIEDVRALKLRPYAPKDGAQLSMPPFTFAMATLTFMLTYNAMLCAALHSCS